MTSKQAKQASKRSPFPFLVLQVNKNDVNLNTTLPIKEEGSLITIPALRSRPSVQGYLTWVEG